MSNVSNGKRKRGFVSYSSSEPTCGPSKVPSTASKPNMLKRFRAHVPIGKGTPKSPGHRFYHSAESDSPEKHTADLEQSPSKPGHTLTAHEEFTLHSSSELLQCRMDERESDYTRLHDLNVFCGTWNVNGKPASSVQDFLLVDDPLPDMYAIGFQELDLRAEALVLNETTREKDWVSSIESALGPSYVQVKLVRLVGMLLVVYIRQDLREHVHRIDASTVGTGLMRKMGNKGGVAIRLYFEMTSIAFVNSHLAAHQEEVERRNEDYHEITSRITFGDDSGLADQRVVLWMGDLNYRLNPRGISENEVRTLAHNDFSALLQFDQLFREHEAGRVFEGFHEGPITFQPSYKYDPGTDNFDTSDKTRTPAWCDRILFRGENVQARRYRSHMSLMASDHKPVSALLKVPYRVSDPDLEKAVFGEELFNIDRMTNNNLPSVCLSTSDVDYADVKVFESHIQCIKVTNTGVVPCHFYFVSRTEEPEPIPPWLTVKPSSAVLRPGASMNLTLTVSAPHYLLGELNREPWREQILIFHLKHSRDYFINVSVKFVPSLFGVGLTELAWHSSAVSSTSLIDLESLAGRTTAPRVMDVGEASRTSSIWSNGSVLTSLTSCTEPDINCPPRPLWALIDAIVERGSQTVELFFAGGRRRDLMKMRDMFSVGHYDLSGICIHSVGDALLVLLESLPEPVIPYAHHQACLVVGNGRQAGHAVAETLPPIHYVVFMKLMAMISMLLKAGRRSSSMLSLFSNILFRFPPSDLPGGKRASRDKKAVQFLMYFIGT